MFSAPLVTGCTYSTTCSKQSHCLDSPSLCNFASVTQLHNRVLTLQYQCSMSTKPNFLGIMISPIKCLISLNLKRNYVFTAEIIWSYRIYIIDRSLNFRIQHTRPSGTHWSLEVSRLLVDRKSTSSNYFLSFAWVNQTLH